MGKQEWKSGLWIVFIIFISLGFPDGLLGSGWPSIRTTFQFDTEKVGIITMGIFIFSFFSSIAYNSIIKKVDLNVILQVSTGLIVLGLLTFAFVNNWFGIILAILCLGLGAGCIDVGINNYVSSYYNEKIMSWVHGCWGIGISLGSFIMSATLYTKLSWSFGYLFVALFEMLVLIILIIKRNKIKPLPQHSKEGIKQKITLSKVHFLSPIYYFCYGVEYVVGLYFTTFLIEIFSKSPAQAAVQVSIYWTSLMIGRFTTGFISSRFSVQKIVYTHLMLSFSGAFFLFTKFDTSLFISSALLGYGFSALYPIMMRRPYDIYSKEIASKIVSFQVGFQFLGVIVLPVIYGFFFNYIGIQLFPFVVLLSIIIMAMITKKTSNNNIIFEDVSIIKKLEFANLKWKNKTSESHVIDEKIMIKTEKDTDFWKGTYYGLTYDNAPLAYFGIEHKTWSLSCKVSFSSDVYFDQCGLAIYQDSNTWMKSGIEFQSNGFQQLFSVVTNRGFSDWAMTNLDDCTQTLYYRISRRYSDFLLEFSRDGINFETMRMFHMEKSDDIVNVGFFASSPGDSSFIAEFTNICLETCTWKEHNSARF